MESGLDKKFINKVHGIFDKAKRKGVIAKKPEVLIDFKHELIEIQCNGDIELLEIAHEVTEMAKEAGYGFASSESRVIVFFDCLAEFEGFVKSVNRLRQFNDSNLIELSKKFGMKTKQEIPNELVYKFLMRGLSNEDFFTSDFLSQNGFKNIFHFFPITF